MGSARVAFAGTPEFAVPTLRALVSSGFDVPGVLTQPDRPKGRGRQSASSAVKVAAGELGIPVSQPLSLRTGSERETLEQWRPDVLIVVAYGLLLPVEVLRLPRFGCLNVHASLLPRWRGAAPIQRAILAGDRETGVTIMQMDAGLDTGRMYSQRAIPISGTDTSGSLFDALARVGAEALVEMLPEVIEGIAIATMQPEEGETYARKLEKAEALIDWNAGAHEVSCRIRALDPWPVAETSFRGESLKLRSVVVTDDASIGHPGHVLGIQDDRLIVQCGSGRVAIGEWQRAGRRSLPAAQFAHGLSIIGEPLGVARLE